MYSFSLDRLLSKAPSDEMGSVTHVVEEEDRRVRNRYGYDAFGNTEYAEETVRNRFRYTGQQYDSVTGQYYLRARYYNPVIGRFLQEDTYYGDGLNLYAYCRNNPVRYYDPSGHDACPKALQDQMKGQGIPDVEIAQKVQDIQARVDKGLSIEEAYKQVTGLDYPGSGGNTTKGTGELFLPDEFYDKNLPKFVTPGTETLPKYDEFGNLKQIKYYDAYGREIGWVDLTDHGYPTVHTTPHWHEVQWNAKYPIGGYKIDHRLDPNPPFDWVSDSYNYEN